MNTAIIYASVHHKNTEKLITAIAEKHPDITIIDTTKAVMIDLAKYDMIGIASGIYMGKFHKSIYSFIQDNLPEHKKVFLMYTCGSDNKKYIEDFKTFIAEKQPLIKGIFSCKGFDTAIPVFKLIGGINKGHPDKKDVENAVQFVENMIK